MNLFHHFFSTKLISKILGKSYEGKYHQPSHMAEYTNLGDWANTRQGKMHLVHDRFKHYLKS
jgi:hypothetical protein